MEREISLTLEASDNYICLLEGRRDLSDVDIVVGKGEYEKAYHCHSVILRGRSPYFDAALKHGMLEKDKHIMRLQNADPTCFLKYFDSFTAEKQKLPTIIYFHCCQ